MRLPVAIDTPCGADWNEMSPRGARARLCASCDKVVHDLSGRTDADVDALLADGPVCVRYLYDAHGRRLLEVPAGARIVPAKHLLSKVARAAALAGAALVFEACGGNDGGRTRMPPSPADYDYASPEPSDAGADADIDAGH